MRTIAFFLFLGNFVYAQSPNHPAVASWKINDGGATGFDGIVTNVQQVQYSSNNVYVSTNSVPDWIPLNYDWPNNPWTPQAQNFVFKITLRPSEKVGNKTATPYGHIGLWTNGVSIYNPKDAKSWNNASVWFQNALYFEHIHMETFDPCLGHPNNMREYHTHVNPTCLYDDADSTHHSPIIGFAFDGFPIYGAYGYTNTDGSGPIKRMRSSYRLRNITARTSLPDGTVLQPAQYGPALNVYLPGAYVEDFEFVNGLGDLDIHNGRFCKTPEYPDGTYAYFVTIDEKRFPTYPYVLGPQFYGNVQMGNTGPNSGHNTITEPVVVYTSVNETGNSLVFEVFPNPASETLHYYVPPSYNSNMVAEFYNSAGTRLATTPDVQSAVQYTLEVGHLPAGTYWIRLTDGQRTTTKKVIIRQ